MPQIVTFNSRVNSVEELIKGIKEMKRLLAEADKPEYAFIPKQTKKKSNAKRS